MKKKSKYTPKGITDKQILKAMEPILKTPTLYEICRKLGYKSHKSLWLRMKRLIKEGKVAKKGKKYHLIVKDKDFTIDTSGTSYSPQIEESDFLLEMPRFSRKCLDLRSRNNWKALSPSWDGYRKDISPSC